jgi:PD-(D/E)XK nuclease superfamily
MSSPTSTIHPPARTHAEAAVLLRRPFAPGAIGFRAMTKVIQIPRRLPPRYDGQPLQHLSHSSYSRFVLCPEDWRRRYVLGEKTAPSGAIFLGRQVDDAITLYYRHILDHGERLSVDQLKDAFWDGWKAATETEREQLGIAWETDLREDSAFKLGLDAVELTFSQLIPHLGEPVAVQRKVQYTLAPGLEWSVLCCLDLETRRSDAGAQLPAVVEYKVKTTPLSQHKADHDFQPAVYLAGRWPEGDPAAVLLRPDRQARPAPQTDRRLDRDHDQIGRPAARRACAGRPGRPPDCRLLRALRPGRAVGVRRSKRLEVQRPVLRGVGGLSGRRGAVVASVVSSRGGASPSGPWGAPPSPS